MSESVPENNPYTKSTLTFEHLASGSHTNDVMFFCVSSVLKRVTGTDYHFGKKKCYHVFEWHKSSRFFYEIYYTYYNR